MKDAHFECIKLQQYISKANVVLQEVYELPLPPHVANKVEELLLDEIPLSLQQMPPANINE